MPVLILKDRVTKIIEPSDKETEFAESILKKSLVKNLHIVNLLCLYSHFEEIKKLSKNSSGMLKVFHGGSQKIFNDMVEKLDILDRKDIYYAGRILNVSKVENAYWNCRFKTFPPTLSKGEEI